jgi:capsular exopolysaccharide synthesis family protein
MRTRSELLQVQAELEALEATPDARPAPTAPATALTGDQVDRHPRIISAKGHMDELARRYRQINQIARKTNDPALQAVRRQWEAARADLDRLRAGVVAELGIGPRGESSGERALERTRLRARLQILKGYQAALAEDIGQLQKAIQEINHGGLDLEAERAEISIAAEFAERVGKEKEYLEVEIGAPDRIRVLAAAKPPRTKDESRKIKAGGVAALGSFVLALLGVSFWEFRARRIDAADEVVTGLGLKLVGALPALPGRTLHRSNASGSLPSRRWQSLLVESIDATRTMLLHASRAEAVRVVMITSAVKGEGKTSVSCHLAASLARAGRSTLLIDCDLRRPAIHRLFDQPVGPGLCELLRGEAGPGEVIRPTAADLSLITAGGCDALALQALAQDGLRTIFAELKNQYDFIIVDSAPVLSVADSLLAGQSVDGVIFSVLRDVSRLPEVHAAYERLAVLGAKMLGVIVSGVHGTVYNSEHYAISSSSR